jgi:hypothetical protein
MKKLAASGDVDMTFGIGDNLKREIDETEASLMKLVDEAEAIPDAAAKTAGLTKAIKDIGDASKDIKLGEKAEEAASKIATAKAEYTK